MIDIRLSNPAEPQQAQVFCFSVFFFPQEREVSGAWWCTPVVPAFQEAELGESLESWKLRQQ